MAIRRIQLFFLVTLIGLNFYLFKGTNSLVYAWDYCNGLEYECASSSKGEKMCSGEFICGCMSPQKRVEDGLNNKRSVYYWINIKKCSGRCEENNKYSDYAVCLDQDGNVEDIQMLQNQVEQDVANNQKKDINTGNLGSPDGRVPIQTRSSTDFTCVNNGIKGTSSALGCIPTDINDFAPWFMQIIFGVAGGIAFLLMVYGFILMATSSGDEKKLQGAKETVTSAITGLLVSIFALFIFKLIAVNILRIPGIN